MLRLNLLVAGILSLLHVHAQNCPASITVTAPSSQVAGKTFVFIADIKELPKELSVTYNWSVSMGTITSGQGTSVITVDPGNESGSCTATVEIGGLPAQCTRVASATVDITAAPEKIIATNLVTAAALNDAVKKFISKTNLKNLTISQNAIVNIYATNAAQFKQIKTIIEKAFTSNKVLTYQFKIVDMGVAKVASVEFLREKGMY